MCLARLLAPPNSEMKITFSAFDVEYEPDCWYDALEVRVFLFEVDIQTRVTILYLIQLSTRLP